MPGAPISPFPAGFPRVMSPTRWSGLRMIPAAHPDHPLHEFGRPVTPRDLRAHRQLVVRESDTLRATKATLEATQRWTVSHLSTSIVATVQGFGYGWYPEDKIRPELVAGTLKELPMREGGERFVEFVSDFRGSRERRPPARFGFPGHSRTNIQRVRTRQRREAAR